MVWTAAWTDFVICLLFGWLGVHKFREKKIGMGILYLCTFGLFCIGWFVDCIRYLLAALHGERIQGNRPMQTKSSGINRDHGRRWNKEKRCLLSVSVNIVKI